MEVRKKVPYLKNTRPVVEHKKLMYAYQTAPSAGPDASTVTELCQNAENAYPEDSNVRATGSS